MDSRRGFVYLKTASRTTSAKRRTARDQIVELGDPGLFLWAMVIFMTLSFL
jgi:hypothetical protein